MDVKVGEMDSLLLLSGWRVCIVEVGVCVCLGRDVRVRGGVGESDDDDEVEHVWRDKEHQDVVVVVVLLLLLLGGRGACGEGGRVAGALWE